MRRSKVSLNPQRRQLDRAGASPRVRPTKQLSAQQALSEFRQLSETPSPVQRSALHSDRRRRHSNRRRTVGREALQTLPDRRNSCVHLSQRQTRLHRRIPLSFTIQLELGLAPPSFKSSSGTGSRFRMLSVQLGVSSSPQFNAIDRFVIAASPQCIASGRSRAIIMPPANRAVHAFGRRAFVKVVCCP